MGTAQRVLTLYGALSITYGMVLGIPISRARMAGPSAPHHLLVAHLAALMQGPVHLGFAFALGLSTLSPWLELTAAVAAVTGSVLFVAGATVNWLQDIGDHFAERSLGWHLLAASSGPHLVAATVVLVGVSVAVLG